MSSQTSSHQPVLVGDLQQPPCETHVAEEPARTSKGKAAMQLPTALRFGPPSACGSAPARSQSAGVGTAAGTGKQQLSSVCSCSACFMAIGSAGAVSVTSGGPLCSSCSEAARKTAMARLQKKLGPAKRGQRASRSRSPACASPPAARVACTWPAPDSQPALTPVAMGTGAGMGSPASTRGKPPAAAAGGVASGLPAAAAASDGGGPAATALASPSPRGTWPPAAAAAAAAAAGASVHQQEVQQASVGQGQQVPPGTGVIHVENIAAYQKALAKHGRKLTEAMKSCGSRELLQALKAQHRPDIAKLCDDMEGGIRSWAMEGARKLWMGARKQPAPEETSDNEVVKRGGQVFGKVEVTCVSVKQKQVKLSTEYVRAVSLMRAAAAMEAGTPDEQQLLTEALRRSSSKSSKACEEVLQVQEVLLLVWMVADEGPVVMEWISFELVLPNPTLPGVCGAGQHATLHYFESTGLAPRVEGLEVEWYYRRGMMLGSLRDLADVLQQRGVVTLEINPSPPEVSCIPGLVPKLQELPECCSQFLLAITSPLTYWCCYPSAICSSCVHCIAAACKMWITYDLACACCYDLHM